MTDDRMIANARRVALATVPELRNEPFYVLSHAELAEAGLHDSDNDVAGFTSRHRLDLICRDYLESQGRWEGEGLAVVVTPDRIRRSLHDDMGLQRRVTGATLHEVGHAIEIREREGRVEPSEPRQPKVETVVDYNGLGDNEVITPGRIGRMPGAIWTHAHRFIRLAVHLHHRCCRIGGEIPQPADVCFANTYPGLERMSSPGAYIDTLWGECVSDFDTPIVEVVSQEPPQGFMDLWWRDFNHLKDLVFAERDRQSA